MGVLDFFGREAGQRRRAALDEFGRDIEYYVPPEMRGLLGFAAEMTPTATLERAGQASQRMFDADRTATERVGDLGAMLSETAGVVAPVAVAGRAGMTAAEALQEALMGISVPARAAGQAVIDRANQPGPVPTMYSNPLGRINKEVLDPFGYQSTKLRDYLENTQVTARDAQENLERIPMSWEEMEGKVVLPFYGDRTSRGLLVEGVNDINFDQPVYTEGGVDFMVGPAAQQDRAIWASNANITKRLSDTADSASRNFEGQDIVGVTGSMAPDANDFATMTGEAMAELVQGTKITKKAANTFDKAMKKIDPEFVGVNSPNLREWAATTSSPLRKSFIRLLDTKPMQDAGFPSPALARYAVTDPTQREMRAGMFGLGASRIDTSAPRTFNEPKGNQPRALVPHSTYNSQITGNYMGSLPPVPQGLLFRDVYDAMEGATTKAGQPLNEAHRTHAIKTKVPAQRMTPEVIDGIMEYLLRSER